MTCRLISDETTLLQEKTTTTLETVQKLLANNTQAIEQFVSSFFIIKISAKESACSQGRANHIRRFFIMFYIC